MINFLAMKHLFLILSLLFFTTLLYAQREGDRRYYETIRKQFQGLDDPIFKNGDTLYLLYDLTDSLQMFGYDEFWWMYREFTREEKVLISYGEDYIPRDISLVLDVNNKFKTLVAADLVNISLTSREEYIAFYEREYKRLGGKMYVWGSYEKMGFNSFSPLYYFKKVYIIVPCVNGTIRMYRCDGLSMVLV